MPGVEKRTEEWKPLRELPITWVTLSELKPHERLNNEELKGFIESLTSSGIFWLPLLISKNEKIIIDGHHRWKGLLELGAEKAPAVMVDYADPEIELGIWFPLLSKDKTTFLEALQKASITTKIVKDRNEAINEVHSGKASFAIVGKENEEAVLVYNKPEACDMLVKIEGESIVYIDTESAALAEVDNEEAKFAIIRKPLSKDSVRRTCSKGEVFPAKSTRHILPFTFQKIDVKINEIIPNFSNKEK